MPPREPDSLGLSAGRHHLQQAMKTAHNHADFELNLLASGSMMYRIHGRNYTVEAGRLSCFWAALPHQVIDVAENTQIMWLTIPAHQLLDWDRSGHLAGHLYHGEVIAEAAPTHSDRSQRDLSAMTNWIEDLAGSPESRHIAALEIEARVRRLIQQHAHPSISIDRTGSIPRMLHLLSDHSHEDINVASIAARVGLNPRYATTIFRQEVGVGIKQYLTRLRICHAQRLLATTDQAVTSIALKVGFGSIPAFYAAFNKELNCSPKVYRNVTRKS